MLGRANAAIKLDKIVKAAFYAVGTPGALDIEGVISQMTVADDGSGIAPDDLKRLGQPFEQVETAAVAEVVTVLAVGQQLNMA